MKACVHSLGRTAVPGPNGHTGEKLGRGDSRGAYNVKANVRLQLHSILDLGVHPLWKVPCTRPYPMCNNMQIMTIKLRWSRIKTLLITLPNSGTLSNEACMQGCQSWFIHIPAVSASIRSATASSTASA